MLRDVVGMAGLVLYAEVGLVLFFAVFVLVAVYLFVTRGAPHWDEARYMPLDDDSPQRDRLRAGGSTHGGHE